MNDCTGCRISDNCGLYRLTGGVGECMTRRRYDEMKRIIDVDTTTKEFDRKEEKPKEATSGTKNS